MNLIDLEAVRAFLSDAEWLQVTEYFGLFICGVDIMAPDNFRGAKLIEINASPGLMPYYDPLVGMPANVPAVYVDKLLAAYKRTAS